MLQLDFNSIKVQLEHSNFRVQFEDTLFQFHKGTIRTQTEHEKQSYQSYFNSIKVQLELINTLQQRNVSNFNSIKVQLEHQKHFGANMKDMLFQFHKGTIRTFLSIPTRA